MRSSSAKAGSAWHPFALEWSEWAGEDVERIAQCHRADLLAAIDRFASKGDGNVVTSGATLVLFEEGFEVDFSVEVADGVRTLTVESVSQASPASSPD